MIGIPVGIFVILAVTVAGFSVSVLPMIPQTNSPKLLPWLVLTVIGWFRLRCMLADGMEVTS